MNKLKQFIDALRRTPVIPLMGYPGIQFTGKTIRETLFHPHAQIEALRALYEAMRPDALFSMMDLTVEAEFLGCKLKISDGDPPAVENPVLEGDKELEALFENKTVGGRMPLFAEVVNVLKRSLDIPVCAYVIGPFTLAAEIMELAQVMRATRKNPAQLHRILKKTTELIIRYIHLLEGAGADLICILEPSAMMISSDHFFEFSGQYCKRIVSEGISGMSVLHICGDTNHLISNMERVSPDGLSLDKQVNLVELRARVSEDLVLIGNIDPVSVLTFGDPHLVKRESEALIRAIGGKGNFILSTGCDIPHTAPLENIKSMMSVRGM